MMKSLICGLILAVALTGCNYDPVARSSTDNPNLPVDTLFTKDGYTVHRFMDGGRYIYYVTPEGSMVYKYGKSNQDQTVTVPVTK